LSQEGFIRATRQIKAGKPRFLVHALNRMFRLMARRGAFARPFLVGLPQQ
jgi:hypothetical protein